MFKRLLSSKSGKNAAASYLAFFSSAACALLSMAVAVRYLGKAEIGLWTLVSQIVAYLIWMDLGIGDGLGRKIGPAIASGDRMEASGWWTLSLGVLIFQGLLLFGVAALVTPLLIAWIQIPVAMTAQATGLFLGAALIAAVNLPSRIYPGILIAQERFHWVPLVQSFIPWVQVAVFWLLLRGGGGIHAYLWSVAASQFTGFGAFLVLVHGRERWTFTRSGMCWSRVRDLLGFGGSLTVNGLATAVLASLPALIIGRAGGLALVPPFGFTQRGPAMASGLVLRTSLSFYPALQRMFIDGKRADFLAKYRRIADLTLAVGLMGGGAVIAFNRSLIETFATPAFFAGHWTNVWFAAGMVTGPLTACLMHLLQYSGSMGKVAWLSVLQVVLCVSFGNLAWHRAGLPGIAALIVLVPLVTTAPYALIRGARSCGFKPAELLGPALLRAAAMTGAILACGWVLDHRVGEGRSFQGLGRAWPMPGSAELTCGVLLALTGLVLLGVSLSNLRKPVTQASA